MSSGRTAVITGVTGQDGVHLARLLRAEGLRVVGTHRPGSGAPGQMAPYLDGVEVIPLDLRDRDGFRRLLTDVRPDEVYNLAALSSVGDSWSDPASAMELNGGAPSAMLSALSTVPTARFLQAGSAEEGVEAGRSPYARGKAVAREAVLDARSSGRFAVAAVMHIHESPLRRPRFVVRKVTRAAAAIAMGRQERLTLGTLDIRRDWGSAVDHVRAMRLMIRADEPTDQEVATGVEHSLRDVVELAFAAAGVSEPWSVVDTDEGMRRPADPTRLVGVVSPGLRALGWEPRHSLSDVISAMVAADRERLATGIEEHERYLDLGPDVG